MIWHLKLAWSGVCIAAVWLWGCVGVAGMAQTFTVDPSRSSVSVSGRALGNAFKGQGPGSLTTTYSGTINSVIVGSTIAFPGGSAVTAANNGSWEPKVDGLPGKEPANYGATAGNFLASAKAAARDLQLDLTSLLPLPVTEGSFDASGLVFGVAAGSASALDVRITGLVQDSTRIPLTGLSTNAASVRGTLTTSGREQALTIPIDTQFFYDLAPPANNDTWLIFRGEVVATRMLSDELDPKTYPGWIALRCPGETDPDVIGPEADSEGDGIPNFVEFAFDLDPKVVDVLFAPLMARIDPAAPGVLTLEFVRPRGLLGVEYRWEVSVDMATWPPAGLEPVTTDLENGWERVTARDTVLIAEGGAARYVRLTVAYQ